MYFHRWIFQHLRQVHKRCYMATRNIHLCVLMVSRCSLFQFVRLPAQVVPVMRQRSREWSAAIRSASEVVPDRRTLTASPAKPSGTMVAVREIALLDCTRSVPIREIVLHCLFLVHFLGYAFFAGCVFLCVWKQLEWMTITRFTWNGQFHLNHLDASSFTLDDFLQITVPAVHTALLWISLSLVACTT